MRILFFLLLFSPLVANAQKVHLTIAGYTHGATADFDKIRSVKRLYVSDVADRLRIFHISGGIIQVNGVGEDGNILEGGKLSTEALELLENCQGKEIKAAVFYENEAGVSRRVSTVLTVEN